MGTPVIEKQAENQQHQIAQGPETRGNDKVDQAKRRQKPQQKDQTAEYHAADAPFSYELHLIYHIT